MKDPLTEPASINRLTPDRSLLRHTTLHLAQQLLNSTPAALDRQLGRHFQYQSTFCSTLQNPNLEALLSVTLEDRRGLFRNFSRRTTTLGGDGDPETTLLRGRKESFEELQHIRNCGVVRMASRFSTPVLTVDTAKIHKVDTANAQSLHGMWMGKCI